MAELVVPKPYVYPPSPHVRRHGPAGWRDYQRYRPWLRDEFSFRCVYCLDREVWRDMRGAMQIDHFEPQVLQPNLTSDYTNLLYLCPACNGLKRTSLLPDPCTTPLGSCLEVHSDGRIDAVDGNNDGELLIKTLALNEPVVLARRRMIIATLEMLATYDWPIFVQWMRYPNDLPDLTKPENTPPSNSKPEGVAESWGEKKRRGELPEVY